MGFRFRKSFKVAPGVKVNFGKRGMSTTVGGKGMHYTKSTTGKSTFSAGIPGTGMSYVETSGGGRSSGKSSSQSNKQSSQKHGCLQIFLFLIIIGLLVIFLPILPLVGIYYIWKKKPEWNKNLKIALTVALSILSIVLTILFVINISNNNDTPQNNYSENSNIVETTTQHHNNNNNVVAAGNNKITTTSAYLNEEDISDNESSTIKTTTAKSTTTKENTKVQITTTKPTTTKVTTTEEEKHTYILNTNKMTFHEEGCHYVKKINTENKQTYYGTKEDLLKQGYKPCGVCIS